MPRLAVCSWSLQPENGADLAGKVASCGIDAIQLALDPLRTGDWCRDDTAAALEDAGIAVVSGMMGTKGEDYSTLETIKATGGIRPDETWAENRAAAQANAELAQKLGVSLVTFHAGFLPHDPADPERAAMLSRLREIIEIFGAQGIRTAFETGQESAETLLGVLDALPDTAGVNFDPANMILYGMGDPIEALRKLAPRVLQIHIKDAVPTDTPGTWGREVAAGSGAVDWVAFFDEYKRANLACDLVIEREAGGDRIGDVRAAADLARRLAPVT